MGVLRRPDEGENERQPGGLREVLAPRLLPCDGRPDARREVDGVYGLAGRRSAVGGRRGHEVLAAGDGPVLVDRAALGLEERAGDLEPEVREGRLSGGAGRGRPPCLQRGKETRFFGPPQRLGESLLHDRAARLGKPFDEDRQLPGLGRRDGDELPAAGAARGGTGDRLSLGDRLRGRVRDEGVRRRLQGREEPLHRHVTHRDVHLDAHDSAWETQLRRQPARFHDRSFIERN